MAINLTNVIEIVKRATELVRESARNKRSLALMSGVTAAGSVASATLAMTGSPQMAVFGVAFVIAFMFVLLVFVSTAGTKTQSRILLAETLAWSFSLMMVAGIGALGFSFFDCWPAPIGTQCSAPPPALPHITAVAYQLDEKGLRLDGNDYLLDQATRKSYEDVAYDPANPTKVAFPLASIIHDYGVRPNGTTEVKVTLLAGGDPVHLAIVKYVDLRTPKQWRDLKMTDRYPGNADGVAAALERQHIPVGADGMVVFWAVSCFTPTEVMAGRTFIQILVEDSVTHSFDRTQPMPVEFVPRQNAANAGCANLPNGDKQIVAKD